ncbi:type 4a pilus biogenesis protein PilO [Verrucomicrobiota bacterium]
MLSYIKSLIAVGVVLLALLCAGLWVQNRTRVLKTHKSAMGNLKTRITERQGRSAQIDQMENRLESMRKDISETTARFAGKDQEGTELVKAIVKAAAESGMKMTSAAGTVAKGKKADRTKDIAPFVNTISYAISLKGTYASLVKFLQNLDSWEVVNNIESLRITAPGDARAEGKVDVALVLSIFSSAE